MPHHRHSVRAEHEPLNFREVKRRLVHDRRIAIDPRIFMPVSTKHPAKEPGAFIADAPWGAYSSTTVDLWVDTVA